MLIPDNHIRLWSSFHSTNICFFRELSYDKRRDLSSARQLSMALLCRGLSGSNRSAVVGVKQMNKFRSPELNRFFSSKCLSLESSFHHVGELVLDLVDGCLGGCLRGCLLHLLPHGAEGLAGGSSGGGGCLVHAPPVMISSRLGFRGREAEE